MGWWVQPTSFFQSMLQLLLTAFLWPFVWLMLHLFLELLQFLTHNLLKWWISSYLEFCNNKWYLASWELTLCTWSLRKKAANINHRLSSMIGTNPKIEKKKLQLLAKIIFLYELHETGNCTWRLGRCIGFTAASVAHFVVEIIHRCKQFLEDGIWNGLLVLSKVKKAKSSSRLSLLMLISSMKLFGIIDTKFKYTSQKIYMYTY